MILIDEEKIPGWIEFACRTCEVPELAKLITVRWSPLFTARFADASPYSKQIRISIPLWPRVTEAKHRNTIIHETCHIIAAYTTGLCKSHGKTWTNLMLRCDEEPNVTGHVDRTGLARTNARINMYCPCPCNTHSISKRRHTRAARGEIRLVCPNCKAILQTIPFPQLNAS